MKKKIISLISVAILVITLFTLCSCSSSKPKGIYSNGGFLTSTKLEFKGNDLTWDGDTFSFRVKGSQIEISEDGHEWNKLGTYDKKTDSVTISIYGMQITCVKQS